MPKAELNTDVENVNRNKMASFPKPLFRFPIMYLSLSNQRHNNISTCGIASRNGSKNDKIFSIGKNVDICRFPRLSIYSFKLF